MNLFKLLLRNLSYYKKEHLLLLTGLILSAAVLTSALIIGDSVSYSLNKIASDRLGNTQQIIQTQERFVPYSFSQTLSDELEIPIAPVLMIRGLAASDQSETRIPNVQVCGVDNRFWKMADCKMPQLNDNEVIVNKKLASKLNLKVGDEVFVRIEKVSFVSNNAPFVPDENNSIALRMMVREIADEKSFGNFDIRTNQISPYTVFFSIEKLSKLNFDAVFANLMLVATNDKTTSEISEAIKKCWSIEDLNLKFRKIGNQKKVELSSDRIFIEDTILNLLKSKGLNPEPQITYLINYIRSNNKYTPYSFVSALSVYPNHVLDSNEIIINKWLAKDLQININDTVQLQYYTVESFRKLEEKSASFIVQDIVDIQGFANDRMLMPAFEGLAGVDHCNDWNAGIPIDFSKIRDKDEKWWTDYKGTPKAFIAYEKAVQLWSNDFGSSTSIRFDLQADTTKIKQTILSGINPSDIGINIQNIKKDAGWSASNAVDFAQLFLALSFFLILSAFILSAMLFSMLLTQRQKEQGIYRSLGLRKFSIYKIFYFEGLTNAIIGSFLGVFIAILFSHLILVSLNSIWFDIVRTSSIKIHILPMTLVFGFLLNLALSAFVIYLSLRANFKKQIAELNKKNTFDLSGQKSKTKKITGIIFSISTALFISLFLYSILTDIYQNSSLFFMSGFLLLASLTSLFTFFLLSNTKSSIFLSNTKLALRNLSFHLKQTIGISLILSIGIFIVISTGANRTDLSRNSHENNSGTGGYEYYIASNIPVITDMTTKEGRTKVGLNEDFNNLSVVQMQRFNGDDASCLNLNKIIRPSILGVNPDSFINRSSFSFVNTIQNTKQSPWELLSSECPANCIPAISDQTVITWGLGKSIGDSIAYSNEKGDTIYLVLVAGLANSVFQGNLIISDRNFTTQFPSISGSSVMLADIETSQSEELKENLENAFRNYGVEIESCSDRLATFNSVTNTYLDIFLILGAIALILGTFGFAIIIVRSIHAAKHNFAMMQAYGITTGKIRKIIIIEYLILLFSSTLIGILTAAIASLQSLMASNSHIPYPLLISLIAIFLLNGIIWIFVGSYISLKKNFISNLRNE